MTTARGISILAPGTRFVPGLDVSRIFISHSGDNNAQAIAIGQWLEQEGWNEIFLDLDPERGIKAGERWEEALRNAANRCEAVIFLVSRAWLGSEWCRDEFRLARHLRKRLFGILIEDIPISDLPPTLTREWQVVSIAPAGDTKAFSVTPPGSCGMVEVVFSEEGLRRLRAGLFSAGLDARFFAWPPANDLGRPPYRGLRPLEAEDAGIFFGRDGPIVEALDKLRGLRGTTPPRLLIILGASGAGKSSFLRAGLFPRVARDDRNFLPLPVIRPGRAAINGDAGLLAALEGAFATVRMPIARADLRVLIQSGAVKLKPLLQSLAEKATPMAADDGEKPKPPTLILAIDQGEELFLAEAQNEAKPFLALLHDLVKNEVPAIVAVFTIRSDNYEALQVAEELDGVRQETFSLPPMPKGAYAEVVKGPVQRLQGTPRALAIEDALIDALLSDIDAGGAKDALPLLAFTLERLYGEYHSGGSLKLSQYDALGRVKGSIEAAVERALKEADADPSIPRDRAARLKLLHRGLIPWLAGIDPDTGAPRRRVAQLAEIPTEARPLIQHLVEQRLLATDVNKDTGEATIEPAHEALLRQWGLLEGWLTEDAGLLAVLEGVKRASRDWAANNRHCAWLAHQTDRIVAAERLSVRPDLSANLDPTDRAYIAACRKAENDSKRGRRLLQGAVYVSLVAVILGLVGWINQSYIADRWRWWIVTGPYVKAQVWPYVLTAAQEKALKPGISFRECAQDCPEMVVLPTGEFMMGAPATEKDRNDDEGPQRSVTIAKPFAVSKFEVTFADWDACVSVGGCPQVGDSGFGRGTRPVIYVSWDEAQQYAAWFSKMTGRPYRLLTEAEWEYAARAGSTTAYFWGDEIGKGNANCGGCGSQWDGRQTAPVGSFVPNAFGLYDMAGNVWQWVQDCYHDNYNGALTDGSAWTTGDCSRRAVRGGSWFNGPPNVRSAGRDGVAAGGRGDRLGFRLGRTLLPP